ncbi:LLM class flavin-dependent oxidoreductase [Skermania sp. ID1734]|uniref:LLM class flavin-dependent oxidoreductase n=1 Tax=Skermania sp. ID1734 TaxID=2597516 RepID=UPI00117F955B|nr:LLM class flavin-dependent oxidoreductase [Skermania sp. ID1734]TSD93619.1 LLM class flavin-dependent oxidoreductase [Skermania sp. ID1734]
MKVGVAIEPRLPGAVEFAQQAEQIGVDSLWVPEVWGYDALTGLAFLAARTSTIELGTFVVQLGSRSPALLATSALSLQQLSGGRFRLGIGVSGPAVMEGWHGVRFRKPVQSTRETIEITRTVSRGERLVHDGEIYPLPLPDSAGRSLRPMVAPQHVPVYVAAMGPANLRLTGEVADGWLGNAFIPESAEVFLGPLREGAERAGRSLDDLTLVAPVAVEITDDAAAAARRHADGYAFTIGSMGAGARNFYNDAFVRLGFGDAIARVAELWQAGDKTAARAAVPIELGSHTNLLGTPELIAQRIRLYQDAGIDMLLAKVDGPFEQQLETLETLIALVRRSVRRDPEIDSVSQVDRDHRGPGRRRGDGV